MKKLEIELITKMNFLACAKQRKLLEPLFFLWIGKRTSPPKNKMYIRIKRALARAPYCCDLQDNYLLKENMSAAAAVVAAAAQQ